MFWEVLDEPQQIILRKLAATTLVAESYLAGGTGLALLIGHRQSLDFDWFIPVEFDPGIISEALSCLGEVVITETGKGTSWFTEQDTGDLAVYLILCWSRRLPHRQYLDLSGILDRQR